MSRFTSDSKAVQLHHTPYQLRRKRVLLSLRIERDTRHASLSELGTANQLNGIAESQYSEGRDEPPRSDVFIDAIVCVPSPLPHASIRYTIGNPPARKVNPAA